jgi:uncharacterized protein YodC (DUF2158 family)
MAEYMLRPNDDFIVEFKKGDIVTLQTGSPNMNVVGVSCGNVLCKWVSDNGTPCSDMFPIECLKIGELKEKYLLES